MKKSLVIILVVMVFVFTGCSFTTANISDPSMTSGVQNGLPNDKVTYYTEDTIELISVAILNNAPEDTTITFIWTYVTEDYVFYEIDMTSEDETDIYIFSSVTNDEIWPIGEYKVDMYIDDREQPDVTSLFSVVPATK